MENYNLSADMGLDITFNFIKDRMKTLGISQHNLAKLTDVNESTLSRNFKKQSEMSFRTYYKICGALKLRPYLITAEDDDTEMQRLYHN